MGRKPRPALHVRGSPSFAEYFARLDRESQEYKTVDSALTALKADFTLGTQIQRDLWPWLYVQKYGIRNLFKFDLKGGFRFIYTLLAEDNGVSVIVLECLTHKEYEKRFRYHVT